MSGRLGAGSGDSPYKLMAGPYLSLGWSPFPLKYRTKSPVPEKYTGADGKWVTQADVTAWLKPRAMITIGNLVYPPGNIALRMPKHIIGLDVDAYDGKAGAETLGAAEAEYGKLPPTWVSSSRLGSPLSGIRYFRIPEGLSWPGDLRSRFGGGVELIRWDHRYAIVGPSIHEDTGGEYFWRAPDGTVISVNLAALEASLATADGADGEGGLDLPATDADVAWGNGGVDPDGGVCDIPDLPESWVKGLTGGAAWVGRAMAGADGGELSPEEVKAWLEERKAAGNPNACHVMQATAALWLRRIRTAGDDGGAHEATRDGVWALLGDSAAGHSGLKRSLDSLWQAFKEAVKARRGPGAAGTRVASGEWKRIVSRGVSKIAAEGPAYDVDVCTSFGGGGSDRRESAGGDGDDSQEAAADLEAAAGGGSPFDFKMDDGGNAQRLKRILGDDVLWCGPLGGWYFWHEQEGVWRLDPEGLRMNREAMAMVRKMELEAIRIENPKARAAFLTWVKASGKLGAMEAASRTMRSLKGVSAAASEFDSKINLINCENGVIELGPTSGVALSGSEAVKFRPAQPADRFTISTGVRYIEGAQQACGDWKDFLERFLPDPEMRAWAQKVAAYSLWGRNSARVIVLLKGQTSTGKTTFAEAIRGALGRYAGPFGLSLLRDNQDERPRPDIVEALTRRLIIAEETSAAWKLHADQIKRATGDGIWRGRPMFGKVSIERVPAFVPWILTNNLPTIEGSDPALEKRIRMLLFLHPVSLAEDDIGFKVRLESVGAREAVLEWLVEGWRAYREDPGLNDMPALVAEATLNAMNELSEFDEMLSDVAQKEAGDCCKTSDLYAAYLLWMGENGHERDILSANKFGRRLTEKGYPIEQAWDPERQRASRIRRGLSLRENWHNIVVTGR